MFQRCLSLLGRAGIGANESPVWCVLFTEGDTVNPGDVLVYLLLAKIYTFTLCDKD